MTLETLGAFYMVISAAAIFYVVWRTLIYEPPKPPEFKLICPDCQADLKFKHGSYRCSCGVKIKLKKVKS